MHSLAVLKRVLLATAGVIALSELQPVRPAQAPFYFYTITASPLNWNHGQSPARFRLVRPDRADRVRGGDSLQGLKTMFLSRSSVIPKLLVRLRRHLPG